jgi:iron(III) transport system ATP-binding protein
VSERALLSVENLTKRFANAAGADGTEVVAVDDVTFSVRPGELFTLLGPSGCGKTTILRCIAGLETPEAGEIGVAGSPLFSSARGIRVRANARGLGMVFQSYAIWPHMTVFDNVAFPLTVVPRSRRLPRSELRQRVDRALGLVRLDGLGERAATDLSGGQQQRLALARALVTEPPLLLLDEPLSSIDAKLRAEMCFELTRLQQALGVTTVYVTHDQEEALAMSSVIAVMEEGRIAQIGTPREVYGTPSSRFVAEFIGVSNLLEGVIEGRENGARLVRTADGVLTTSDGAGFAEGARVVVVVRAEDIHLESRDAGAPMPNRWPGVVQTPAFRGDSVDHEVLVGQTPVRVRTDPKRAAATGDEVTVVFSEQGFVLFPADG